MVKEAIECLMKFRIIYMIKIMIDFIIKKFISIWINLNSYWLFRWLRINFRYYFYLKNNLSNQLNNNNLKKVKSKPYNILVPIIETSHYQVYQILIIAKALELRGVKIYILLCDSFLPACEIKSIKNSNQLDNCLECRFNRNKLLPLFNFQTLYLSEFINKDKRDSIYNLSNEIINNNPKEYIYDNIDIIPIVNDGVTRYYYGNITNGNNKNFLNIKKQNIISTLIGLEVAKNINDTISVDSVMSNMSTYSPFAPYYRYFKLKGIKFNTINYSTWDYNSIRFNLIDYYNSNDRFNNYLKYLKRKTLLANEKEDLYNILNKRFSGSLSINKDDKWFDDNQELIKSLKIDSNKRNILLPSNVHWDKGLDEVSGLFDNVIDWVITTIKIVKQNENVHLYIKPHPAEKLFGGEYSKGIIDIINENFNKLPKNVTIIPYEYKISPYKLFSLIDVGVLFSGTLGIEMMLNKIPVILTGSAPYSEIGLVNKPISLNDYAKLLFGEVALVKPKFSDIEMFSYFLFKKTLIPWNLTKKAFGDDFKGYSIKHLNELEEGQNKYLDHLCDCILNKNKVPESWE
jgi:hypothetical protein